MKTYKVNGVTLDKSQVALLNRSAATLFLALPCRPDDNCNLCSFSLLCPELTRLMDGTNELLYDKGDIAK